jgi:tetratricopeptide (TPR) repeat protein
MGTLLLGGCTSTEQKEMDEARIETDRGHFRIALSHLEKIIIRSPHSKLGIEAAREAARLTFYEIKDFPKAAQFYQQIVVNSDSAEDRMNAQKQIVSIYFDHLTDYQKSVVEINRLVVMLTDPRERNEYKMKLARAYYYQNNFTQAENEAEEFLRGNPPSDQRFDMIFLKGNIELAKKDLPAATEVFKTLLRDYPERALKDNVGLTLSVCYEEMKDFKSAIEVLEKIKASHPMPEYIDIRIKRLRERLQNQPGAHGKVRK